MDITQRKGEPRNGTPSTPRALCNRFPAFGKRLMDQRIAGQVPPFVVVAFDWNIGRKFPRVVIPDDLSLDDIELRFLAGLDVTLAYREKHSSRVPELAQAILRVNPRILNGFACDIPQNFILKNIAGEIFQ
jgi:hypothetical protein